MGGNDGRGEGMRGGGAGGRGRGGVHFVHGGSRMTVDPRIPTLPGWSASCFHQPGRHLLAPSAKRREVFGESHEG